MAVDRRGDRLNDAVGDVTLARCLSDFCLLLICELDHIFITKAMQIVCLNDGLEHWEAVLDIGEVVVSIDIDSMDLDLVTWTCNIYEIVQNEYLFLAGYTARRNGTWRLLNRKLLIVSIQCLHLVNLIGASLMANNTLSQTRFCILRVRVANRSLQIATLASEVHLVVLREDLRALGDHSSELDQSIQVHLAQLSDFVLHWQLVDPHIDILIQVNVVREDLLHDLTSNRVEDRDHMCRFLSKPNREIGLL